jgi:hypothetical protein
MSNTPHTYTMLEMKIWQEVGFEFTLGDLKIGPVTESNGIYTAEVFGKRGLTGIVSGPCDTKLTAEIS